MEAHSMMSWGNSVAYLQSASSIPSNNVVPLRKSSARVLITEPSREWRGDVEVRLSQLTQLPRGWDGYLGVPTDFMNANFALRMLEAACGSETPAPQIVPGGLGDLQVEWHTQQMDIELHVRSPYEVHAWRLTPNTGPDGEEIFLTNDFSRVTDWIKELIELSSADFAAAV